MTNLKTKQTIERDIPIQEKSVILSDAEIGWAEIGWWDLMYQVTPPQAGASFNVPVFYVDSFQTGVLTINISAEPQEITLAGRVYTVYTCTVPQIKSIHYVTSEGQLVRVENTEKAIIADLVETSAP